MNVFTITTHRDDPRLLKFAEACAALSATKVMIITRPDHVAPDPSLLVAGQAQVDHFVAEERKAAAEGRYSAAQVAKEQADEFRGQLQKVWDDSAKWITEIYDFTGPNAKSNTGYAVMSFDQWPENVEWSVQSVLERVRSIDANGIGGMPFQVPLSNRVFIPLSVFDSTLVSVSVATKAEGDPNRPKTARTKVDPTDYSDSQKAMLMVLTEPQKKVVTLVLGWDRGGVGRSTREAASLMGVTQRAAKVLFDSAGSALSNIDVNLKLLEVDALTRKSAEIAARKPTDDEDDVTA